MYAPVSFRLPLHMVIKVSFWKPEAHNALSPTSYYNRIKTKFYNMAYKSLCDLSSTISPLDFDSLP